MAIRARDRREALRPLAIRANDCREALWPLAIRARDRREALWPLAISVYDKSSETQAPQEVQQLAVEVEGLVEVAGVGSAFEDDQAAVGEDAA